ncbi:mycofactocin biosynthesis chaperone MftB [Streptomyces sp. NPDC047081]|uniref:Mycofactocin biosynthesis chaperone MftB n=1 Tax=Streptomyces cylindrosporus TaxID=2927583 RepID=A0ABS9YAX9_9ACTN|nr:mycofactocin biosynthesis chaperone MftB [Streptomyces cylindrosporus]MCI3274382.1 mycofactocin biosynthesis chaperone MftB [Streptomyces cylindrosporus]
MPSFDMAGTWTLHPQVAVRPEPFGALLYHFGTRRLSFLKDLRLLAAVRLLTDEPSAADACRTAGIHDHELARYRAALETLATSHMIVRRTPPRPGEAP